MAIDLKILGPLQLEIDGIAVPLRGAKRRMLLARLTVDVGRVVSVDELIDCLWDGFVTPGRAATLHSHVAHLRRALGDAGSLIRKEPAGYMLDVRRVSVDAHRFENDVRKAEREQSHAERVQLLAKSLDRWNGRALVEFEGASWADLVAARLDERRIAALELMAESSMHLGRNADAIRELETIVRLHPLRSGAVGVLMQALASAERHVEALRLLKRHRDDLIEVGLDPPPSLYEIERSILSDASESAAHGERGSSSVDDSDAVAAALDGFVRARLPESAVSADHPDIAVAHYRQALTALDASGQIDNPLRCELLINLAESQRRIPNEDHVKTLIDAARLARTYGDRERLARVCKALGRSFAIVTGERDDDRIDVMEEALTLCGSADTVWRARTLACLAGELQFAVEDRARGRDLADEAVEVAHRVGDITTLAATSAIAWDVMWHPGSLAKRSTLSRDMQARANLSGAPLLQWQANMNVLVDALCRGDLPAVDNELATLLELAGQLQVPIVRCRTALIQGARSSIAGDLVAAKRHADEALTIAQGTGRPELGLAAMALLVSVEVLDGGWETTESLLPLAPQDLAATRAMNALIDTRRGRSGAARTALNELTANALRDVPDDATWPLVVVLVAEAASQLSDVAAASVIYRTLAPYADQFLCHSSYCFGSAEHVLGLCATTMDDLDAAVEHFANAASRHRRALAPVLLERTNSAWATALRHRGAAGDIEKAMALEAATPEHLPSSSS